MSYDGDGWEGYGYRYGNWACTSGTWGLIGALQSAWEVSYRDGPGVLEQDVHEWNL